MPRSVALIYQMDQLSTYSLSFLRPGRVPVLALLLSIAASSAGVAQTSLTLRQAVDRALGENPESAIARAGSQEADASATLARTQLLPRVNFTEDISRGNDPVYAFGTRLRQQRFTAADFALNALNRPEPLGNFATRLSASWVAFDSLKTQREIRRADLWRKSSAASSQAMNQKIVLDVVQAYQSVLYAEREIEVAKHEQETAAALLDSVDDRVKAGLAVESDRMTAQVNGSARKQELIAAQGNLELAWAQLRVAMGAPDLPTTTLQPITPHEFPFPSLEQDLALAASTRPDLAALGQAQSAQGESVRAAKSDFGPRISAYGNWEDDRTSFAGSGGNNWVAGVQIGIDILPFSKRAQLAQASAAKLRMNAQLAAAQQQARLQVSQAHIHRQTARLSLETARASTEQATESLRILRNRYSAGLATITDLLRAEDAERQSQSSYWRAVYGNAAAYADQLFATGALTPKAAEELQ